MPLKPRKTKVKHGVANTQVAGKAAIPPNKLGISLLETSVASSGIMTPNLQSSQIQAEGSQKGSDTEFREDRAKELNEFAQTQVCKDYRAGKCPHGYNGKNEVNGEVCELGHP